MKKLLSLFVVALTGLTQTGAQTTAQWPEVNHEAKPASRWWIMGSAFDETSVNNRMAEYAAVGLGTMELTPIYGVQGNDKNELGFLSNAWMDALRYTQDAAAKNGMRIDMNTGTGWPFGGPSVTIDEAAGKLEYVSGTITGDGAAEQTMSIALTSSNKPKLNRVMAYPQKGNDGQPTDVTQYLSGNTLKWVAPAGKWLVIAIYNSHTMQQVKRAAPGGVGYVMDHLDSTAVANYLKVIEDAFEKSGVPYPKTFFNDSYEVYNADWTPKMFEEFEKYRGYKLEDNMDKLLALGDRKDTDGVVRADYRETLNDMLLNNFTRQWTAWAHKHGAKTRNQAHGSPGNLIDIYAAVDIPEIEGFGLTDFGIKGLRTDPKFTRANYSDLSTLKYASSAAHVTGKPLTSSETFTWLTEHFRTSLSQMKPDMDLMFVAGVNHMFFHGTTYTPDNVAWPGWKFYAAIDMSPTNSIWRDAPYMMKYMERCQSFMQMGKPDNDLLVYVPFQDAWHKTTGTFKNMLLMFPIDDIAQKLPEFVAAVNAVQNAGLDCDYISDNLLLSTEYVDGELQTIGGTRYKGLVIPASKNMPEKVKAHLDSLSQLGAKIAYAYDAATLATFSEAKPEALRTQLGLKMIRRTNDTGHHYFISNLSRDDVSEFVELAVDYKSIVMFDPMTGKIYNPVVENGKVFISLKSGESVILQTYAAADVKAPVDYAIADNLNGITLDGEWQLSFMADAYPQISATYRMENGPTAWENLDAQTAQLMGTGVYTTTFTVSKDKAALATGGWSIDLGDVRESARVYVNGEYAGCAWSAPFIIDLGNLVKEGENTLKIEVTNLPANRIRQMDIDGKVWRIFEDVNILAVQNGSIGVSGVTTYADRDKMPSGLNSVVKIMPKRSNAKQLIAKHVGFQPIEGSDKYYPVYRLEIVGKAIQSVSASNLYDMSAVDNKAEINGDGTALYVVKRGVNSHDLISATAADGTVYQAIVPANGEYELLKTYDFTAAAGPDCGWYGESQKQIDGFSTTTGRRQAKKMGTSVTELYNGLTITSNETNIFYFYPGYGMVAKADGQITLDGNDCDVAVLSYLMGDYTKSKEYAVADSVAYCPTAINGRGFSFSIKNMNKFAIYRMISVFSPVADLTAIENIPADARHEDNFYYNMQGMRVLRPSKGLYIRNGKKVVVK